MRGAILYLHPERIGHGVRCIENSHVVRMLYEQEIALEVCPTSNLYTGVVTALPQHPLTDLIKLRLRATVNTDDPSIFDTTLTDEVCAAVGPMGLTQPMIYGMLRNAVESAFIPSEERPALRAKCLEALSTYPGGVEAFDPY